MLHPYILTGVGWEKVGVGEGMQRPWNRHGRITETARARAWVSAYVCARMCMHVRACARACVCWQDTVNSGPRGVCPVWAGNAVEEIHVEHSCVLFE